MRQLPHRLRPFLTGAPTLDAAPARPKDSPARLRWSAVVGILAVLASSAGAAVFAAPASAAAPLVVSLTFDDATPGQVAAAGILNGAGLKGTFFTPSSYLDAPGFMTTEQALKLQLAGNEIGGHTVTHPDLILLGSDEAKRQICNDRVNLTNKGFRVTSFAYPFASANASVIQTAKECGYNSARGLGDLESAYPGSAGLGFAETLPPADPWWTKAPDQVESNWTLTDLQNLVTKAQPGGGWVQVTFHHVGENTSDLNVPLDVYTAYVQWLAAKQSAGQLTVKTVDQVIGGPLQPAIPGPTPPTPPAGSNILPNPDLETPGPNGSTLPQCWDLAGYGTNTRSARIVSPGRTDATAQELQVSGYVDGDGKLLARMDLGECAPGAAAGHAYSMSAWYKSTAPTQFVLYSRNGQGTWSYWTSSPLVNAATGWTQTSWTSPAAPAGTTAISVGLSLISDGILTTDDYVLTDAGIPLSPGEAAILAAAATYKALGTATGPTVCTLVSAGCSRTYTGGTIFWTAATGAHLVKPKIAKAWASAGSQGGVLGYPTGEETGGLKNGGSYQAFQGGRIYLTPLLGAKIVKGGILNAWLAAGAEAGAIGYPLTDELGGLKNGGSVQLFTGGAFYWSPASGAHVVKGAIALAWLLKGAQAGKLGYPTSEEYTSGSLTAQDFQGGRISWSSKTGIKVT